MFIYTYFIWSLHRRIFTWYILKITLIINFIIVDFFPAIYCIRCSVSVVTFIYFWNWNRRSICFFLWVYFICCGFFRLLSCWRWLIKLFKIKFILIDLHFVLMQNRKIILALVEFSFFWFLIYPYYLLFNYIIIKKIIIWIKT